MQEQTDRIPYATDLSDEQWEIINPHILTSAFLGAYMLFRKYMGSDDCGLEILPCI